MLMSALELDPSAACPGGGDRIFDAFQQSTTGALIIQNVTLCVVGDNEIFYDIGFLDQQGAFIPLVTSALSSVIRVLIGEASGFRLSVQESSIETTYTRAKSIIVVILHDRGLNVSC